MLRANVVPKFVWRSSHCRSKPTVIEHNFTVNVCRRFADGLSGHEKRGCRLKYELNVVFVFGMFAGPPCILIYFVDFIHQIFIYSYASFIRYLFTKDTW